MVNVRYRSAADIPRPPEPTPPSDETQPGQTPVSAPPPPADPTAWTPALVAAGILLAVFAFLLGSTHIGNADVWLTLATGRLIQAGQYHFGVDPFSWASDGYWSNPSWLGSWLFYLFYQSGTASLGIFKGLVGVALAGLLVASRTRRSSIALTLMMTALALLAASPRFIAQTSLFSFLGVAVLVWVLVHDGHLTGGDRPARRYAWLLPLLFLAWSNLDAYFVLGLYVLVATAVGRLVDPEGRRDAIQLLLVAAASVAVCVLNPHGLRNFDLAPELSYVIGVGDAGQALSILQAKEPSTFSMTSALSYDYLYKPNLGANIAGLSVHLLALINVGSFLVAAALSLRTPGLAARAAVAGGLGVLAFMQWRFIPFYALVAGPITVMNVTAPILDRKIAVGGLVAALGLGIILAWPGWLHLGFADFHGENIYQAPRRVEWELTPDPSLKQAALHLGEQAKTGDAARIFQPGLDLPSYVAFFAPEAKCGIDSRLGLFAKVAADYAKLREDLLDYIPGDSRVAGQVRAMNIDHLAFTNTHLSGNKRTRDVVERLGSDATRWRSDYADGRTRIFRHSPTAAWTGNELLEEWDREAFAPTLDQKLPLDRPADWPVEPSWWEQYLFGYGPMPLAADTARLQHGSFQRIAGRAPRNPNVTTWQAQSLPVWDVSLFAPAFGVGLAPGSSFQGMALAAVGTTSWMRGGLAGVDLGPPALPILAQRNMRRALLENPRHPAVRLLQVELLPMTFAEESYWARHSARTKRVESRTVQRATAIQDALTLMPNTPQLHLLLGNLYIEMHLFDAALEQFDLVLRDGLEYIPPAERAEPLKAITAQRDRLRVEVERRRASYELKAAGAPPMVKFWLAMYEPYRSTGDDNVERLDQEGRGLILEALRVLRSMPANLPPAERLDRAMKMAQLELLLGRSREAMMAIGDMTKELREAPPQIAEAIPELQEILAVTSGDYKMFDDSTAQIKGRYEAASREASRAILAEGFVLWFTDSDPQAYRILRRLEFAMKTRGLRDMSYRFSAATAEMQTLRGIFLLERGDTAAALHEFESATSAEAPFADRRIAERYRTLLRRYAK